MLVQTQEARIILAIEAIRTSKKLSRRKAAKIYEVPKSTLRNRMNGRTTLPERRLAAQNLTELEEQIIVNYILDRDSRGFSPGRLMWKIWRIGCENRVERNLLETSGRIALYNAA